MNVKFPYKLNFFLRESLLAKNITANYVSVGYLAIVNIIMMPIYLHILGAEQWGIVALCLTLQGCMGLIDAGLAQVMPRDIARANSNELQLSKTFMLFSRTYGGLALSGFLIGQGLVTFLGQAWLKSPVKADSQFELALRLVLLLFLFQFANNANLGFFNGTQRQAQANFRQCLFSTARHGLAFLLLTKWEASAISYLIAFVSTAFFEFGSNRYTILKSLPNAKKIKITIQDYKAIASEVGLIAAAILLGMLATQADRIVLPRMVSITDFGHYVIVANVGLNFLQLQYPLQRAFLPRIASASKNSQQEIFRLSIGLGVLCVLPCILLIGASRWLLFVWTHNENLAKIGTLPLQFILAAVAVNSCYAVIYQKMLTQRNGKAILLINISMLFLAYPLLYMTTPYWGIAAGGITWFCISLLQFSLGYIWHLNTKYHGAS